MERPTVGDDTSLKRLIDGSTIPTVTDGVAFIPVGDEAVLYVEEQGLLHRLDPVAAEVVHRLDGRTTLDDVISALAGAFEANHAVIDLDVRRFVRELVVVGLLHLTDARHDESA